MPEGVPAEYTVEVEWEGGERFRGGPAGGPSVQVDGEGKLAPSPVNTLLVALASCTAVDVVEILGKRRTPPTDLKVTVEFSRAPTHPRRLTDVLLRFRVATASERHHVERAIELSLDKYCSIAASLAPDTRLEWEVELQD